jgi:hypothetical protein
MKKILTLAAVIVFVFTLAAATYAVDFKASGLIRVRTAWYMNTDGAPRATNVLGSNSNFDNTEAWMDSRFRLKMDLVASEDLKGVIYFEGDSSRWGELGVARNTAGAWGAGGSDRNAVELKQFYIDFNVPGLSDSVPTNMRIGTQWLAIRSHMFLGADGATIRVFMTPGPVRLYLNWSKPWEGTDHNYDDADLYSTRVVLALPDFPVQPGGFFAYWHSKDYDYTGLFTGTPGFGQAGPFSAGVPAGFGTERLGDGNFWWLGFNVDGKIGPAALKSDFIYFDGEAEPSSHAKAIGPALFGFSPGDADYGGWAAYADVNVPISQFTVGGTFMFATGDDVTDTRKVSPEFDAYRIPPGSEANPSLGTVFWAGTTHDGVDIATAGRGLTNHVQQRWFGGLWTLKGYGSFKPLDWLKVTGYAMYIGDTTEDGNTIGNAIDATEASGLEDEDYIGFELGAIVDLNIYKNLTYSVAAGWLIAGDALDTVDAGTGLNESPDDPWAIVSQLIYKF